MPSYPYFTKKIKTGGSVTIISPKFRGSISATVNCWRAGLCDGLSKLSGNVYHIRDVVYRKRAPLYGSEPLFQAHCHKIQKFFRAPPQNRTRTARKTAANRYLCRCHAPPGRPMRRLLNSTQLRRPNCRARWLRRTAHCGGLSLLALNFSWV